MPAPHSTQSTAPTRPVGLPPKAPKRTLMQSLLDETFLMCLGFVCMTGSIGYFFIAGNKARYAMLVVGFLVVVLAAFKRRMHTFGEHFIFLLSSVGIFGALLLIGLIQEQQTMQPINLIFQGVAFALFVCGYLLGAKPRIGPVGFNTVQAIMLCGISSLSLVAVLRFTDQITFYEVGRGFGETDLNPVGLAYATSVLFFAILVVLMDSRNLFARLIAGLTCGLAFVVLLVSGSRGATIYTGFTVVALFAALILKKQFSFRNAIQLTSVAFIMLLVGLFFGKQDFALFDRFDVFMQRWEQMTRYLTTGEIDSSISARQVFQQDYINSVGEWILLGQHHYVPYPHNQFIEWGARFGLLGLALSALFTTTLIYFTWHLLVNRIKIGGEQLLVATLLIFSFLQSMTSLSLEINRALFFCYGYALAVAIRKYKQRTESPRVKIGSKAHA